MDTTMAFPVDSLSYSVVTQLTGYDWRGVAMFGMFCALMAFAVWSVTRDDRERQ